MTTTQNKSVVHELVPLLFVQNITASAAFYRDQFGFDFKAKWEPGGKLAWCRLQRDGAGIMLQQAEDEDGPTEGRGRGVEFYFNCDDVEVMYEEVIARGLICERPKVAHYKEKQLRLRDPDGYQLCFQGAVKR